MDVYVTNFNAYPGVWVYQVWVDGKVYDEFSTGWAVDKQHDHPLTWSQMVDVAQGYREALEGYRVEG